MTHTDRFFRCHTILNRHAGFTLIELMIVIAIIAIVVSLALPVYSNYAIRAKIGEGLSLANSALTSVGSSCIENPAITSLSNTIAGYSFDAGVEDTDYVADIQVTGSCNQPVITITSQNTGQSPAPILKLTGEFALNSGQIKWTCLSENTPNWLLPGRCRS